MYNLILADLFKVRKSSLIKVALAITTVSAVCIAMVAYMIPKGIINESTSGAWFLLSDANVINILGAVMAGVFICGDFDNKIIHESIATGNSRKAVIVAKIITFSCSIAIIIIPYVLVTAIAISTGYKFSMGSVAVGFLNLLTVEAGKVISISEIWKLMAVMITLLIVYLGQLSICVPLALAVKKPVLVVAIYYVVTILCAQLMRLKDASQIFDNIFACTPYGGNYIFINLSTGASELLKAILVSLVFIIAMFIISYFIFRKSEIK